MASDVRLAARIPARRATSETPPFGRRPLSARRRAAGAMRMRYRATGSRAVMGLAETSTMRAVPRVSRCVSLGAGRLRGTVALQEVAEQEGGHLVARFGTELAGLEDDEGVGLGVGHDVGRSLR